MRSNRSGIELQVSVSRVRTVPVSTASSAMMFQRLPALKLPTDTTSERRASTSRDGERLQRRHQLRADIDRVDAVVGRGAVGHPAVDRELEAVACRHQTARPHADLAHLERRHDVEAEDGLDRRVFEDSFGDHHLGAAVLTGRRALLGGLEDEDHCPVELVP